jgi:hypothetical protein
MRMSRVIVPGRLPFLVLILALTPLAARAEEPPAPGAAEEEQPPEPPPPSRAQADGLRLELSGYGELQYAWHDHGPDQNRAGGAQKDSRLTFDTTRLVFELEAEFPRYDLELEAEVELEHGGTGAALELEYEEFGEYETEVEKGGEVLVEELYVEKGLGDRLRLRAGRFYVAVGLLSGASLPTDYLGTARSEAETSIIPAVWDEMGLQARLRLGWGAITAQVVNGLDSTGFSSQRWIALGHQRRFEVVRATDLAGVLRVDVNAVPGLVAGLSGYYGGSSRNRPKPDLVEECEDAASDEVAPCGYVKAAVLILDAHASYRRGRLRGSALALFGHLQNADRVSERNQRLSNALGVLRTPVGDNALALGAELGVDLAPSLGLGRAHRLEPFARVDWYDTLYRPRAALFDNPRFARLVLTGGAAYTLAERFFAKLDLSHRRFGSSELRAETTVRASTGFVY